MFNCDTHNDEEYFQNHYRFSQGLLHDPEEYVCYDGDDFYSGGVFQTLLFSKCQKDPLSTVSKFGYC